MLMLLCNGTMSSYLMYWYYYLYYWCFPVNTLKDNQSKNVQLCRKYEDL